MEGFWSMIAGEDHQRRNTIRNPIIQVFHSYVQKDFGENERNKGNRHGVELALLVFDCQAANRPHSPMINRWCCEATSSSGDISSGCYLSMLAISLIPGITRNPEHLLAWTSLGIYEVRQEHKWR
jgi:hypothetical protein